MKKIFIVLLCISIGMQTFAQESKEFSRVNAGGIGYGKMRGANGVIGFNFLTSANSFAFSLEGLFFDMDKPLNGDYFNSELSAKFGVLSPIKGHSYFSFLTGIARVRGEYTELNTIDRGWYSMVKEENVNFTTLGVPVELTFHIAMSDNIGFGLKSYATYNKRTPYYGGLIYLTITSFSK